MENTNEQVKYVHARDWMEVPELDVTKFGDGYYIQVPIVGHLVHKPTGYCISVYKPISRFKRMMLKWCFGIEYKKV